MDIKTTKRSDHSGRKASFYRRHKLLVWFIFYNIILLGFGLFLFQSEVHFSRRQRIVNKFIEFSKIENSTKKVRYTLKDKEIHPKQLSIGIEQDQLQVLQNSRVAFLQKGFFSASDNKASGTIAYKNNHYPIDLSLTGYWKDYRKDENTQSYKVRVKNNEDIEGMNSFRLLALESQVAIQHWLKNELFKYVGLSPKQYGFAEADINGEGHRIFTMEEISDLTLPADEETLEKRLAAFRQSEISAVALFDINKLAKYLAVKDLFGGCHPSSLEGIRFYLNPSNNQLEPDITETGPLGHLEEMGLSGAEKQIEASKSQAWYEAIFNDKTFYASYTQALERLSSPDFLDVFFEEREKKLYDIMKLLGQKGFASELDARHQLYANRDYIALAMKPYKLVHAYFNKYEPSSHRLQLEISNILNLPAEITGIALFDSLYFALPERELIQANEQLSPIKSQMINIPLPENFTWADSLLSGLNIQAKILGTERIITDEVQPYSRINRDLLEQDLIRQKPNAAAFEFLEIDEGLKQIRFKKGNHRLTKSLILPNGYKIIAQGGTKIDLTNNANILSYSSFDFEGTEEEPVLFYSSDSTAQGITILYAKETSQLQHVHFDNLSIPNQSGWSLTSAITFYESPVNVMHCVFNNNRIGDDYLNIVRAEFTMDKTTFYNANADAFDCDYCVGKVANTRFLNSGNDAIDISGSKIALDNVLMDKVGDKGISAGENSSMTGQKVKIRNAEIAVTSKDFSSIDLDDIEIIDCRIAYTAFRKKSEFGPASIRIKNRSTISGKTEIPYLIEDECTMTIAGEAVKSSLDVAHVKQILYGIKFGKSSK